jgi:hypothetical protein
MGGGVAGVATDDDLATLNGTWVSPPEAARLMEEADKALVF